MAHVMKLRLTITILLLGAFGTVAAPAIAAEDGFQIEQVDTSHHPQVSLTAVVAGEKGAFLQVGDLRLTEGGREIPVTLRRLPTEDLELVLVMDTSGSMDGAPMAAAKHAAASFLERLPEDVDVAVLGFGGEPALAAGFSAGRTEALSAVSTLQANGETALYDALVTGSELFSDGHETRRALILLSDGGDTVSSANFDDAATALQGAGVDFYAVALEGSEFDITPLTGLTDITEGQLAAAEDPEALAGIYESLASQLVNRYRVSYRSQAHGPTTINMSFASGNETLQASRTVEMPVAPTPPTTAPQTTAPPTTVRNTVPATTMPELRPGSSLTPPPLAQSSALMVGLGLFFIALLVGGLALFAPRSRRVNLIARFGRRGGAEAKTTLSRLSSRASFAVEGALDRRGKRSSLALALEKAGIVLRPGEFGLFVLCGSLIAFALGLLLGNLLVGIVLAVLIPVAARFLVSHRASRRQAAFADQLNDTLLLLAGTLRGGYGFMQAADTVAREGESPTSEEFRRLVLETRLGRPVEEALAAMHERVGSVDFGWVVQAIEMNLESGGNLAEVLETVAGTIRDRAQLRRQVKSLSAEGRMSGWILLALPFALAGVMAATNPAYISELYLTVPGRIMLGVAVVLMTIGTIWIRKTVKVKF
jgi:tight adherence protein B